MEKMSISSYFNRRLRSVVLYLVNVLKQRSPLTFSTTPNRCSEQPLKRFQMLSMPSRACTATIINSHCTLSSRYILLRRGPGHLAWFGRYPSGSSTHSSPRWNHKMNELHTTSTGGFRALQTLPNFVEDYGNVWFTNISARSQRQLDFT